MPVAPASMRLSTRSAILRLAAALAGAIPTIGVIAMAAPHAAKATPQFATQTGLSAPARLTDFGNAFLANGDKVPEKK